MPEDRDDLMSPAAALAAGPRGRIGYFARFGVDEALIRHTLATALAKGGEYADLFFQHRVSNSFGLEDGEVNRAFANVELGVGVRVVRGDQTGYGFTEDLTREGLQAAARTAAAIADGPAREAPQRFHVASDLPSRYPVQMRWEDVRPEQKLPILNEVNQRVFQSDPRVRKVSIVFSDQASAILIADSNGRLVEDVQPMTSLYVSCVAEQNGKRE